MQIIKHHNLFNCVENSDGQRLLKLNVFGIEKIKNGWTNLASFSGNQPTNGLLTVVSFIHEFTLSLEHEMKPFVLRWQRETRITNMSGRLRGEVAYYTPCGRKLRQYPDVVKVRNDHFKTCVAFND